ncbi:hypothetical protein B0T24DRAFT_145050 [Lasiosphaeria ovina]|uniref:Protein HRI1 n=1 Tax=Lasiosphaeria ovina TaxID=92902 RepID=A0AAE0KLV7_9PEZI|nr:hypothetical protein B0T24DRAFT_145050 [Lasiosphaeria ovina]
MGDISIREYIRWLPDAASEPTSTIVLTSPGRRFVDLRILNPPPGQQAQGSERLPLSRLDWAIAGTSESWPLEASPSTGSANEGASRAQWRHWIDSRTADTRGLVDEGVNYPQPPDGAKTLEKGRMVNPASPVLLPKTHMVEPAVVHGPTLNSLPPPTFCF